MKVEEAKALLQSAQLPISSETRLPNGTGTQLKLDNDAIVNVYDTGKFTVQGKNQEIVNAALGAPLPAAQEDINTKVFVVYGHDEKARNELEIMLRRWGLEPLILDQLPSEGQTIIEKLEKYTSKGNFAVVLATPDDEGHRAGRNDENAFRARQNVVLELGMLLSKLGRNRVAILLKQQEKMERPSDIQGLIYIPFKDNLQKDAGQLLAKEMDAQGYKIDISKL